jgi:hypothetical protein
LQVDPRTLADQQCIHRSHGPLEVNPRNKFQSSPSHIQKQTQTGKEHQNHVRQKITGLLAITHQTITVRTNTKEPEDKAKEEEANLLISKNNQSITPWSQEHHLPSNTLPCSQQKEAKRDPHHQAPLFPNHICCTWTS